MSNYTNKIIPRRIAFFLLALHASSLAERVWLGICFLSTPYVAAARKAVATNASYGVALHGNKPTRSYQEPCRSVLLYEGGTPSKDEGEKRKKKLLHETTLLSSTLFVLVISFSFTHCFTIADHTSSSARRLGRHALDLGREFITTDDPQGTRYRTAYYTTIAKR